MGQQLRMFFEDEKAALLQQIDAEFEKVCFTNVWMNSSFAKYWSLILVNVPSECRGFSEWGVVLEHAVFLLKICVMKENTEFETNNF